MNYAVIFAGGVGHRMYTSKMPKQFIEVGGKPIIIHTILNFERHKDIDGICVICVKGWTGRLREMIDQEGIKKARWIVEGAETGQQSIYNGLKAIYDESEDPSQDLVLINDGVRPFVEPDIIDKNIECVKNNSSSVTVCPVPETVVEIAEKGEIRHIPIRSKCYLSKAPQGFWLNEIIDAHHRAMEENRFDCTNSAELMRRYGHSLYVVYDTDRNIKITTPTDLVIMKGILDEAEKNR